MTPFPPLYQEQAVNILYVCVFNFYDSSDFKFKFKDGSEKFDLLRLGLIGVYRPLSTFSAISGQTLVIALPKADDRIYGGENDSKGR